MLEGYCVRPQAVDRVRVWWIGAEIERYVGWLAEQSYSRCECALWCAGAVRLRRVRTRWPCRVRRDLPAHVEAFIAEPIPADRAAELSAVAARQRVKNVRGPIEQMLGLVVPGSREAAAAA